MKCERMSYKYIMLAWEESGEEKSSACILFLKKQLYILIWEICLYYLNIQTEFHKDVSFGARQK